MEQDTVSYDSVAGRPLPKWLTDQRDGVNTYQPVKAEMKDDKSLAISLTVTGIIILLAVAFLTIYILRRKKNQTL
jgi:heme/copper-type cytochrome/quinol oxidase subunit 2